MPAFFCDDDLTLSNQTPFHNNASVSFSDKQKEKKPLLTN